MMSPLTHLAVMFVRAWTRILTWGMPRHVREARRAEIESDLWESQHQGTGGPSPGSEILLRLVMGIPSDQGSEPRVYAESILKTCKRCLESPLMSVAGVTGSNLTKRIRRIMTSAGGDKLTPVKKLLLALMLAVVILTPFLIGVLQKSRQSSDDADKVAVLVDPGPQAGGPYRPGNGIENPTLTHEVKPQYTPAAMRARIQGSVLLECVVSPDGTVGNITVTRSLDAVHGLDQAAVDAARQWRFEPGTRQGKPVPVLVTIEIAFTLK